MLKEKMKTIDICNGYIQYPKEWIVIEPIGLAKECEHVGVVRVQLQGCECVPHFIFFSPIPIHELSHAAVRRVLDACVEVYQELQVLVERGMLVYPSTLRMYELLTKGEGEHASYHSREYMSYPFDAMVVRRK